MAEPKRFQLNKSDFLWVNERDEAKIFHTGFSASGRSRVISYLLLLPLSLMVNLSEIE